jgi:ferredoxin-NADP reductase/nitrite reductase/ring-hydroxylating ferredoxin subunit
VSAVLAELRSAWHPVAAGTDLVMRHAFQAELLGRELVAWRADDGFVNVWENRCLHRGVRLSIGINDGTELVCRYHGWRYASRSGGCTYIPAHPADAPARTTCNRTFPAVERYGLVWTGEGPVGDVPAVAVLEDGHTDLRHLPYRRSRRAGDGRARVAALCSGRVTVGAAGGGRHRRSRAADRHVDGLIGEQSGLVVFVQPVDAARCVVRPVLAGAVDDANLGTVRRHHARRLEVLRERVEEIARTRPEPEPYEVLLERAPVHVADPSPPVAGRTAPLRVRVARKWPVSAEVMAFELESIGDPLPTHQPGAHIDVHLPNGLVRQYSLTNGPGEAASYVIGVKREPDSRGGSAALHDTVREGDVLAVSEPRNNFVLRRDSPRTVLLAGGIGLTPLLAMARALHQMGAGFEFHVFARGTGHLPFTDALDALGPSVRTHLGLDPDATGAALAELLAEPAPTDQVYVCGPGPMLDATRSLAAGAGWADEAVHFEYFANTTEIDDSSTFEVSLARSALTLTVPAGSTILEVMRENGVAVPSSCEQGACGTCSVAVIEGEPDHQDVYLSGPERARGDRMMVCVSRARGDRLVLDV